MSRRSRTGAGPQLVVAGSEPTVAELVRAAQSGNRKAFAELHRRYHRSIRGIILARAPIDVVDDLVQDVFAAALSRIGQVREPEAFPGWLSQIARRKSTDTHRRRAVRHTEPLPPDLSTHDSPYAEAKAVLEHIQALPATYAEPLVLRLVEGMTGPEIAKRLDLSPNYVRVNLHRGLKMLRERLEPKRKTKPLGVVQ